MKCKVLITVLMLSWMIMTSSAVYSQANENDKGDKWWLMTNEEFKKWFYEQFIYERKYRKYWEGSLEDIPEEIKNVFWTIELSKSQLEILDLLIKHQDSGLCKKKACQWLFYNANEDALPLLKKVVQEELKVIEYIRKEVERGNKELQNRVSMLVRVNYIPLFPALDVYEYLRSKICQNKFDQIKDPEEKFKEAVKMLTEGRTTLIKDDIESSSATIRGIGLKYLLSIEDERVIP